MAFPGLPFTTLLEDTVISRNFARAIIVFKHRFSPALKWTRHQYESFQKLNIPGIYFFHLEYNLALKRTLRSFEPGRYYEKLWYVSSSFSSFFILFLIAEK